MPEFLDAILKAVEVFRKKAGKKAGIVSHNDSDGVCSAAIIAQALKRENIEFEIFFATRVDDEKLTERLKKMPDFVFFLDYGAKEDYLIEHFPEKFFMILDHHPLSEKKFKNALSLNPNFYGIDGSTEICGAGVSYLFAKTLNEKNSDLAYLAVAGAIGDIQRDGKLNREILKEAVKNKIAKTEKGLKFYGWNSRPLHKALEWSTEPFIPGVSGSESGAINFLKETGIELKDKNGKWRTISDLSDDEKKKLASALILQRHALQEHPENIFGEKIFIQNFPIEELRDAEVLSGWLNSCAKLEKFDEAFGVSLGDMKSYEASKKCIQEYKRQIISAINYFFDNRENRKIVQETGKAIYFFCPGNISAHLASTISTMLSRSIEQSGKVLFCFSSSGDKTKVSARLIGKFSVDIDLGKLCEKTVKEFGTEGGGHKMAAGATIPKGKEQNFIKYAESELNNG